MVCGTTSNAGKSTLVAGLCRVLARRGVAVAPFKAQNMALNSAVTASGHEIGRAQAHQAFAAGLEPEVAMNPVLLKPTGERSCQVVVLGRSHGHVTPGEYQDRTPDLLPVVVEALADLRRRFDVVLLEGAGSPAEVNLLARDIVNLPLARRAGVPAIVVADIDPGGVFAALYGTVALLPDDLRCLVRGFVVNKLRGDATLLGDGFDILERHCGVPTLGVLPWVDGLAVDGEDSLALDLSLLAQRHAAPHGPTHDGDLLDVAVARLPRVSNITDVDPLGLEPGVRVRVVEDARALGDPDLVVLPGTKATVADLGWLRASGLADALARTRGVVMGICGGYQMLGDRIDDTVESGAGRVDGLGLLPVTTRFAGEKVTRRRAGTALGCPVTGYQIHHGRVRAHDGEPFVTLTGDRGADDGSGRAGDGAAVVDGVHRGRVFGTTVHGLFECDEFRRAFLSLVAARAGKRFVPVSTGFASARTAQVDRLAEVLDMHLDLEAIERLIGQGAGTAPGPGGRGATTTVARGLTAPGRGGRRR